MPHYFLLLSDSFFQQRLRPALADSWRRRSFEPCRALCVEILPAAEAFAGRFHITRDEILLARVGTGLAFDRDFWSALAGELLWFSASEIPEIHTAPETLCCLLAPDQRLGGAVPRERFAPIQQAHYGTRDLIFGGRNYRPEQAGFNDANDVIRLADYLASVDPGHWTPADLSSLTDLGDDEERAEELEYARDWFPALRELYERARLRGEIVVCETLAPLAD